MADSSPKPVDADALPRCPECRAPLKKRRSRGSADACELVCGGCGQMFDVCDDQTATELRINDGKSLEK